MLFWQEKNKCKLSSLLASHSTQLFGSDTRNLGHVILLLWANSSGRPAKESFLFLVAFWLAILAASFRWHDVVPC
jgi:hypothetical protein